ncbi:RNA polymerase sigma factor SigJ [Kiloniella sp. EL199]|uniref:RNA polymerase sigma factor SigJ n=1 Tax=Kiloniella sp. EL199 TaxID=2107581 RepID=UPI000EA0945E|nr:RNA polymerase sigma factor SigJ [Kiloniella sp. EL199]
MMAETKTDMFELARPRLMGLAYRLLGSISDAQDIVQDTYLKWISYSGPEIENPAGWLSRVCTNRCLDELKSANRQKLDYIGSWIPDQIQTEFEVSAEEQLEIASSLTTAFLLLLERLTPKERAAYLLHDVFSMPFDEVACILDMQSANCRKLATRAREYVAKNNVRHVPEKQHQEKLLEAFQEAIKTGNVKILGTMLRAESDLRADSGGKVLAVQDVIVGHDAICRFVEDILSHAWSEMTMTTQILNGTLGLLIVDEGNVHATLSFGYDAKGQISQIYIMRHPEKLKQMTSTRGVLSTSGAIFWK